MDKFVVNVFDRKSRLADTIEITTFSASQAEKLALKLLESREGDWYVTLVSDVYIS